MKTRINATPAVKGLNMLVESFEKYEGSVCGIEIRFAYHIRINFFLRVHAVKGDRLNQQFS